MQDKPKNSISLGFFGGGGLFCLNKIIIKDGGVRKISTFKYHFLF